MKKIDIHAVDQIIRDVAISEIMPRFRKLAEGDVQMKGKDDPVTIADQESERKLTERFLDYLPGSAVVGEESVAHDKAVLHHLTGSTPIWIIDPIDGTRNFVSGKPEFAVMVALVRDKQPVAAWIHDPNSGDTIMAEHGGGVWLRGKKLRLAAADKSVPTIGLVGARVKKLLADAKIDPGSHMPSSEIGSCAGFDYPRLFAGDVNFADATTTRANFLFYRHTNPWDHMPGLILAQEGGGYAANWAGQPYDMSEMRAGLIVTSDRDNWDKVHSAFQPIISQVTKNPVWEL